MDMPNFPHIATTRGHDLRGRAYLTADLLTAAGLTDLSTGTLAARLAMMTPRQARQLADLFGQLERRLSDAPVAVFK